MVPALASAGAAGSSAAGGLGCGDIADAAPFAPHLLHIGMGSAFWDSLWRFESLWHFLAGTYFCQWLLYGGEWLPARGVCRGWRHSLSLRGADPARFRVGTTALLHGDADAVGAMLRSIHGLCFGWARESEKCDISRFRSGIMDALCVRRPGMAVLNLIESLGGLVMVLDGHRRCGTPLSRRPLLEVGAFIIPLPLPVRGSLRLGWPEGGGLGLGRTFDIFDAFYSTCRRGRRTHDCFCEWCQEGCVVHLPLWVDSPASRVPPSDIEAATVAAALEQLSLEGSTEASIYGTV